jgi:hypothetical protein
MNGLEKAALAHAAEWLRYQKSPQYARDLKADGAGRAALDKKVGHSPKCSLTKCHPECARAGQ